jgi:hypothetical protein
VILDGEIERIAQVYGDSEATKKVAITLALRDYETLILVLIKTMVEDWESKIGEGTYSLGLRRLADEIKGVSSV